MIARAGARWIGALLRKVDRRIPAVISDQHGAQRVTTTAAIGAENSGSTVALIGIGAPAGADGA